MSIVWAKHFCGIPLQEPDVEKIPNAFAELSIHVTFKTVEAGTAFGSVLGPLVRLLRGPRQMSSVTKALFRGGTVGCATGLLAGVPLTYMLCQKKSLTEAEIYDRCFRLRANKRQLNIDRGCLIGGIVGSLAGTPGMVIGLNSGLVLANLHNYSQTEEKDSGIKPKAE